MKDINFFESFIEKREFKLDRKIVYFTLASFLILAFVAYSIFNSIVISQESKIVANLKATAEDPKTLEKVAAIKEKEIEVNEFRDSVAKITQLDNTIESRDIVQESLLNNITSIMPEEVFLTSLNIRNEEINLVGNASDKWSIAEFQKGLENLDIHEDIFISNISLQDMHYNFSINMLLRGEYSNGED